MSALLLDEQLLCYQPALVRRLGLAEAAIVQQLHYWAQRATNSHDGHVWVYKTYADWSAEIGISSKAIRGALERLRKAGIVAAIQSPIDAHDRTLWWRIDHDVLDAEDEPTEPGRSNCPEGQMENARGGRSRAPVPSRLSGAQGTMTGAETTGTDARARPRISGRLVNAEHWQRTAAVLESFNDQTGRNLRLLTSAGEPSEAAKRIYGRVRAYPDITTAKHEDIIRRTLASRWWGDDPPSIGVVFGPNVFEENITRPGIPKAAARGYDRNAAKAAREAEREQAAMRVIEQRRQEART